MSQTITYTVSMHDVDAFGVARPSSLLRLMQDAAEYQMKQSGMDAQTMLSETGRAFLLSRARMQIYEPIYAYDVLTARSWACPSRGYSFLRNAQICRAGKVVCELSTVWAWTDVQSRRLLAVADFDASSLDTDAPLALEVPFRFGAPKDLNLSLVGEHTVSYRDVDLHRHMNNTNYPDMLCGFLPMQDGMRVLSITLFFQNEAPLDQTLKVYASHVDSTYYLRTVREDGQDNVRAEIQLEPYSK